MKNYLFAPFNDDADKIKEFNTMLKSLNHLIDAEHELHGIRVFVCRLESYHDSIIQDMHNNKAEIVDGLLEESNLLKARLQAVNDDYNNDTKVHNEYADGLLAEIKELKADNVRLVEQVGSNSGNSSSTHTHTISREIQDYINHHPEHKEVRLFILPIEEFDEDECCHKWLTWDEGVEV